jgi:hypothetical protein
LGSTIDSSDSNSHLGGDSLPADALDARCGNSLHARVSPKHSPPKITCQDREAFSSQVAGVFAADSRRIFSAFYVGIVSIVGEPRTVRATLERNYTYFTNLAVAALLVLTVWCLAGFGWKEPYQRLLVEGGFSPLPKASVTPRTTLSGLTVYIPTQGDQCWNAPLPCTPYFDEMLRLRDRNSMRDLNPGGHGEF